MRTVIWYIVFSFLPVIGHAQKKEYASLVAQGQMPNLAKDKKEVIHLVYGKGDSILYCSSKDGATFTAPALIAVLPRLYSFATRGPQIAATASGLIVTACTQDGNIYGYRRSAAGKWRQTPRLNDRTETAKEGLMALGADGQNVFAVWLNVKDPKGQDLYGARSTDGGKTWSKNIQVYDSPDNTVCECCKPSVTVKGSNVYIMYRNWLNGNRDLYLTTSSNGGQSFGSARKLGIGSWKLNACPMDGGGLVLNGGVPQTVWRREGKIYAATPAQPEKEIGQGRSPSLAVVGGKNVYAWTENGHVVVLLPDGRKQDIGKGSLPLLKALNKQQVLCVWENEKQIYASVRQVEN